MVALPVDGEGVYDECALDLTGQLGAFLMKKEVARGATVARTPYWSLASRANN